MKRPGFSQDEFLRLMTSIEVEGGHQAEDDDGAPLVCKARRYQFSGPKSKPVVLKGCANESIFEVAYDSTKPVILELPVYEYDDEGQPVRDDEGQPVVKRVEFIDHPGENGPAVLSTVQVCAVHDALGWWPRYAHVMESDE